MIIADDDLNVAEPERSPVPGLEDRELDQVALTHRAARDEFRELVKRLRKDREAMVHEAAKRVHG
jgi:hypothetical protein